MGESLGFNCFHLSLGLVHTDFPLPLATIAALPVNWSEMSPSQVVNLWPRWLQQSGLKPEIIFELQWGEDSTICFQVQIFTILLTIIGTTIMGSDHLSGGIRGDAGIRGIHKSELGTGLHWCCHRGGYRWIECTTMLWVAKFCRNVL